MGNGVPLARIPGKTQVYICLVSQLIVPLEVLNITPIWFVRAADRLASRYNFACRRGCLEP